MKQMKSKKERGITLIALVVTIIVLIVLAGISINLMFGANGIINRAKQSKTLTDQASINEQKALGELDEQLEKYLEGLPENTKDNPQVAGTEVKIPEGWYTTTPAYISTEDGSVVKKEVKVASVTAVATGNGETVPVPKGFYYVGGTKDTGVVISDNPSDKNKYAGYKEDGKTEKEVGIDLEGNQFVWIPCTSDGGNGTIKYEKTSWGKQNAEWDKTTPKAELTQIEKYEGFYVGRYEAGLASNITEFTTNQKQTGSNQVYNIDGVPQSKAGVIPWMFIDWTHSKTNAESMYNNNYVSSGLITGTQWDVILNTMISKSKISTSDLTDSSAWGNYIDNRISYNGRLARADYGSTNSSVWTLKPFEAKTIGTTTNDNSNNGELLTTGASVTTEKYHIFDLAGNVWEWTEETSLYATSGQYQVLRGGGLLNDSGTYTACYRNANNNPIKYTNFSVGFRTVLYIK